MPYRYHIGPLVVDETRGPPVLTGPAGALGWYDTRSFGQFQAWSTGQVLIWTAPGTHLGLAYLDLGVSNAQGVLTMNALTRAAFALRLGILDVTGDTLIDCLFDALTIRAGGNGPCGLMPDNKNNLSLHLPGHSLVKEIPFTLDIPEAANVIRTYQANYEELAALKSDVHRKYLDELGLQFNVPDPENYFIPDGMPKETRLPRATTYQDDCTRGNQAPIGTSTGANSGQTWNSYASTGSGLTLTTSAMGITSNAIANKVDLVGTYYLNRLEGDLSGVNHHCQLTFTQWTTASEPQLGPCVRMATGTDGTCYIARAIPVVGILALTSSNSSGGLTDIVTPSATFTTTDVLDLDFNGSTYTVSKNGSPIASGSNGTISGGVRCGAFSYAPLTGGNVLAFAPWLAADDGGSSAALSAIGSGAATFSASSAASAVATMAAASVATFGGKSAASGVLTATGSAAAQFVGQATGVALADMFAAGTASVQFAGMSAASASVSAAGHGLARFVGRDATASHVIAGGYRTRTELERERKLREDEELIAMLTEFMPLLEGRQITMTRH